MTPGVMFSVVAKKMTPGVVFAAMLLTLLPAAVDAAEHYVVVVSGVSGGEKYAARQQRWRSQLVASLTSDFALDAANVVVLDEESEGITKATSQNLVRLFADLRRQVMENDTVMIVLIGHGTFDGDAAKFNLVGPDLIASEWKEMIDPLPGRVVVINTTESSFPFLEKLSQRGRVVVTATAAEAQRFSTVFPEYFIRALGAGSDSDKNGRVSIWEAFAAASVNVRKHYEQAGQLSTERPLLDDNGDGLGREADEPGEDGTLARMVYLDAEPRSGRVDVTRVALERQRVTLEKQLEELKARKDSMPEAEYYAALERIVLELANIAQRMRQGS